MTTEGAAARVAPTLEMVAERAGVSRATVSRVVNGSPRVSDETVAAVTAAIAELRYTPNRAARPLANRRAMAIALVIPEDTTRFFGDPYFAAIVQGISSVLDDTGYALTLHLASTCSPSSGRASRWSSADVRSTPSRPTATTSTSTTWPQRPTARGTCSSTVDG